jgi:hypothetical protein
VTTDQPDRWVTRTCSVCSATEQILLSQAQRGPDPCNSLRDDFSSCPGLMCLPEDLL